MYAPGHPPTPPRRVPSRAWIVSMRVLFGVLSVGSLGILLWAPLLRLAIVCRRAYDWWLTGAGFVFVCVLLPVLGRDGSDEPTGIDYALIPLLLVVMLGSLAYYLVGDIRHYERLARQQPMTGYGYGYGHGQGYGYGYGYQQAPTVPMGRSTPAPAPMPMPAAAPTPVPSPPLPVQQPPAAPQLQPQPQPQLPPQPPAAPQLQPQPQPQLPPQPQPSPRPQPNPAPQPQPQPGSQRIDQVRAELDELSDYLRKEEGR
ncbi:hypothetical protein [Streptomyces sp. NPDC002215]|uniref:hypothetical protein n=1 Tax=Streptomyces sp. NPDC002215 TaxID=3154412 RepID=UPI00332F16ED